MGMTAFSPGEVLTASANNDNLCSHSGSYKCKDRKGRESLADANAGEKCGDRSLCMSGASSLHPLGAEAMWRNALALECQRKRVTPVQAAPAPAS